MEAYAAFEDNSGGFAADFEEVYLGTRETPNVVKYVPQDLTPAEQAQARQNIGVDVFWVTVTEEGGKFSSDKTFDEIWSAYNNGRNVFARYLYDDTYLLSPLVSILGGTVAFDFVIGVDKGIIRRVWVRGDDSVDSIVFDPVGNIENDIGDIDTALDRIIAIQESLIGGAAE